MAKIFSIDSSNPRIVNRTEHMYANKRQFSISEDGISFNYTSPSYAPSQNARIFIDTINWFNILPTGLNGVLPVCEWIDLHPKQTKMLSVPNGILYLLYDSKNNEDGSFTCSISLRSENVNLTKTTIDVSDISFKDNFFDNSANVLNPDYSSNVISNTINRSDNLSINADGSIIFTYPRKNSVSDPGQILGTISGIWKFEYMTGNIYNSGLWRTREYVSTFETLSPTSDDSNQRLEIVFDLFCGTDFFTTGIIHNTNSSIVGNDTVKVRIKRGEYIRGNSRMDVYKRNKGTPFDISNLNITANFTALPKFINN